MRHGTSSILHHLLTLRKEVPQMNSGAVRTYCKAQGWMNGTYGIGKWFSPQLVPMEPDEFLRVTRKRSWLMRLLELADACEGVITEYDFYSVAPKGLSANHNKNPEKAVQKAFELFVWFWTVEVKSNIVVAFDDDSYFPDKPEMYLPPEKGWVYLKRCTKPDLYGKVRQLFLAHYIKLVRTVAGHMAMHYPRSIELGDLINTGTIGLIEAFERFDPSRKIKFETYAVPRIKGAILDELRNLDWVPRSVRSMNRELEAALMQLTADLAGTHHPGIEDAAEKIGITPEELSKHLYDVNRGTILSLDEVVYPEDDNRQVPRIELAEDPKALEPSDWARRQEIIATLDALVNSLSAQQSLVIRMYYWWEMTLKAIAEMMHLSESRVCQIHTKALLLLREKCCTQFGIAFVKHRDGSITCIDVPTSDDSPVHW